MKYGFYLPTRGPLGEPDTIEEIVRQGEAITKYPTSAHFPLGELPVPQMPVFPPNPPPLPPTVGPPWAPPPPPCRSLLAAKARRSAWAWAAPRAVSYASNKVVTCH